MSSMIENYDSLDPVDTRDLQFLWENTRENTRERIFSTFPLDGITNNAITAVNGCYAEGRQLHYQ